MFKWKTASYKQKNNYDQANADDTPRDEPILYRVKKGHTYLSLAARRPAMPPTIAPGSPPTAAPARAPNTARVACLSAEGCCRGINGE